MIRKTLKVYWWAIRPRKWLWIISLVAHTLFFIGANILEPLLISSFINDLTNIAGKAASDFYIFLLLWVGLHIYRSLIGRVGLWTWFYANAYTLMDVDMLSFKATMSQGSDFFANNFTGSLVTKFNRFNRSLDTLSRAVSFDLNALFVQIAFPSIILFFISPLIAVVFLIWAILFACSLVYLHKRKYPKAKEVANYDSKVTGVVADIYTNALSVKMFSSFTSELAKFKNISNLRAKSRIRNAFATDYIRIYKIIVVTIVEVIIFSLSIKYTLNGQMSPAEVLLIQLYLRQLITSLWDFGKLVEKLEEAFADAMEMTEIHNLVPSVLDPPHPIKISKEGLRGEISVAELEFSYEDGASESLFSKLNLSVPAGQKIGLVGPSGGGKTTFTKLLLRFMDLNTGSIKIDDYDISKLTQDDLRRLIAYVPQEPLLFHRSIYDNIAYGNQKASKAEVYKAAKLAHATEFIEKLPNGYETLVGERGIKLSGGQKQRIAIARAMLKKAPILLLDEATSALDSKSEKLITSALHNLMKNRTTIVIAHRLSTIRELDRIILMKDGKVLEDGTHKDLLERGGDYAELWSHQHDGFIDS